MVHRAVMPIKQRALLLELIDPIWIFLIVRKNLLQLFNPGLVLFERENQIFQQIIILWKKFLRISQLLNVFLELTYLYWQPYLLWTLSVQVIFCHWNPFEKIWFLNVMLDNSHLLWTLRAGTADLRAADSSIAMAVESIQLPFKTADCSLVLL